MGSLINFFGSSVFANIIGLIGILISIFSIKQEKDKSDEYSSQENNTNSSLIYNSSNSSIQNNSINFIATYYFPDSSSSITNDDCNIIIFVGLVVTFIVYAVIGKALLTLLLFLIIALIIRYKVLGIANIKQLLVPITMIIVVLVLTNSPPEQLVNYWKQLKNGYPIIYVLNLLTMIFDNEKYPLLISILGNIAINLTVLVYTISNLFQQKNKIKVQKWSNIIWTFLWFAFLFLLLFSTESNSLTKKLLLN